MEDGTLEALRDGKLASRTQKDNDDILSPANTRNNKPKSKNKSRKKSSKKAKNVALEVEDAETDEGFFEE